MKKLQELKDPTDILIWHLLKVNLDTDDVVAIIAYLRNNGWMMEQLTRFLEPRVETGDQMTYPEVMEFVHKLEKGKTNPFRKAEKE